ncbi:MAG: FAD-dependent oxidoreductase [Christensenellaceae bacterium]
MKYPKLFSRGEIGNIQLKNRIVMSPMGTNIGAPDGDATGQIIRYYEERAKGGTGLIITELTRIDNDTGIGAPNQLGAHRIENVRKLTQLADAVHKYDTKIMLQLHHAGREIRSFFLHGRQPVAPSPIACKVTKDMPRELTTEECEALVGKFINGAVIAKLSGMDGVELHAAHGYLICQFLSPYTNKRTDKYGGDLAGRMTFLLEIVDGIKAACGPGFPVVVRISADEYIEGGLTLPDGIEIAKTLEQHGVCAIDVSAGIYESGVYGVTIETLYQPTGWKKHLATEVRKHVNIPVIAVNHIKTPDTAEEYLSEGVCDFISLGRAHLSDPYWAHKSKTGREAHIRQCLSCQHCFKQVMMGKPLQCTLNPVLGREYAFNEDILKKDGDSRTVAIVGGGPAGMQASITLAKRGFKPVLFEKTDSLGGTLRLAALPSGKGRIGNFIETLKADMEEAGVEVRLNMPGTVENVQSLQPYGVMVATGGKPIVPNLQGVDKPHVHTAEEYLAGTLDISNKKVAVIGGGVTGLETAEVLSRHGNKVTVVEMLPEVGTTIYKSVQIALLGILKNAGVETLTNQKLVRINDEDVILCGTQDGKESALEADVVLLALGVTPDRRFAREFMDAFANVVTLGDASKPGQIADAVKEGHDKAFVF